MDLSELSLPASVKARLAEAGFETAELVAQRCDRELQSIPGIGAGAVVRIKRALVEKGMDLTIDPWAPEVCAREGEPKRDAVLTSFWLCEDCTQQFIDIPFGGKAPEWSGTPAHAPCSHCNLTKDIEIRQWFLCGVCSRVLASIGRGIASARYVLEVWDKVLRFGYPDLTLAETDPPTLQRRARDRMIQSVRADFTALDSNRGPVFGIELKSGPGAAGGGGIGGPMSEFQLDVSDCDGIIEETRTLQVPIYVFHAQIRSRPTPPTAEFVPTGMWWVAAREMVNHLRDVRNRPRETRPAAYYRTAMFRPLTAFPEEVTAEALARETDRIRSGDLPALYSLGVTRSR